MTDSSDIDDLPELISEAQAYELYRDILRDKDLRRARQKGEIGYYQRGRKISYGADELREFIARKLEEAYTPSRKQNSGSDDRG